MDLVGKLKLAPADEAKGLGSGENDYAGQLDRYYLAGNFSPFVTAGYRMPGNPPGQSLSNVWFGTLGLGYKGSPSDSVGLMWDVRQASRASTGGKITMDVDGHVISGTSGNEATLYWVHRFTPEWKIQHYAVKGFSDASADRGLGLMFSRTY